jgi:hypothetical protein
MYAEVNESAHWVASENLERRTDEHKLKQLWATRPLDLTPMTDEKAVAEGLRGLLRRGPKRFRFLNAE